MGAGSKNAYDLAYPDLARIDAFNAAFPAVYQMKNGPLRLAEWRFNHFWHTEYVGDRHQYKDAEKEFIRRLWMSLHDSKFEKQLLKQLEDNANAHHDN